MMLVYEMNGQALQPQHGYPLRLLLPGWYGMASVKWLDSIEAIGQEFQGFQMTTSYRYTQAKGEPGEPGVDGPSWHPGHVDQESFGHRWNASAHRKGLGRPSGNISSGSQRRRWLRLVRCYAGRADLNLCVATLVI